MVDSSVKSSTQDAGGGGSKSHTDAAGGGANPTLEMIKKEINKHTQYTI